MRHPWIESLLLEPKPKRDRVSKDYPNAEPGSRAAVLAEWGESEEAS